MTDEESRWTPTTLIDECCRDLPDGWEIMLLMERGAAEVQLWNPDGDEVLDFTYSDQTFAGQVLDAIRYAKEQATP